MFNVIDTLEDSMDGKLKLAKYLVDKIDSLTL